MTTIKLLDNLRARTETGTLYAAAKKAGLPLSTLQGWQKGRSLPSAYHCLRLAEVLDLPLELVVATVEAERTRHIDEREAWTEVQKKYSSSDPTDSSTGIGSTGDKQRFSAMGAGGPGDDLRAEKDEEGPRTHRRIICRASHQRRPTKAPKRLVLARSAHRRRAEQRDRGSL